MPQNQHAMGSDGRVKGAVRIAVLAPILLALSATEAVSKFFCPDRPTFEDLRRGGNESETGRVGPDEDRSDTTADVESYARTQVQTDPDVVLEFLGIDEIGIYYQDVDSDERVLRNTSMGSQSTRSFTRARVWTRTWHEEKGWGLGLELGTGLNWAGITAKLGGEIERKYAMTEGERREEREEVTVHVSPGASVKLTLTWKQRWQRGVARFARPDGEIIGVPFRVAKGMILDQAVTDL